MNLMEKYQKKLARMKTKDEIEKLKADWKRDPCWDIEFTEGFEFYEEELKNWREEYQNTKERQRIARLFAQASHFGIHGNLTLTGYLMELEERIIQLEKGEKS